METSKNFEKKKGNHLKNKEFTDACIGISREKRRELHDALSGKTEPLSYKQVQEHLQSFL